MQEMQAMVEELPLLARNIDNNCYQQIRESLNGRMLIQADNFVWEYKLDSEDCVMQLFFASHHSLHLYLL